MPAVLARFARTIRDGVSLFWLAPALVALIIIPEFLQHVAEIRIGMFESKDAFRTLANDPRRMVFGYLKIAGFLLAILAAVRFWGAKDRAQKWWDLRNIAWKNFLVAFVLMLVTGLPGIALEPYIGADNASYVSLALTLATLPLIPLLVAGLIGDTSANLVSIFRTGWLASLRILIFTAAVWVPLQWLHGANHGWAMGQNAALVWALMIFDALVVGLLAALAGTAIHHGYELRSTKETPR